MFINTLKLIAICMVLLIKMTFSSQAQSSFHIEADVVSNYVWRGQMINSNLNIQPTLAYTSPGELFTLGAWGSYGVGSYYSEINLFASLSLGPVTLSLVDYFVDSPIESPGFFDYKKQSTAHALEVIGEWEVSENFPLLLTWGTFIFGDDLNANEERMFSSYLETAYGFELETTTFHVFMGVTPWESFYAESFNPINIGFGAEKSIAINGHFSIPVSASLSYNPYEDRVFMVLGISF